jgi:hypothetical protein
MLHDRVVVIRNGTTAWIEEEEEGKGKGSD